ncbi:unnamed protein product [Rotaria sp. Silwood2]|nr:unnamed protein product [Rotaria sp. Silwood2]CAF2581249.1 unnamed protein product [Rotaria sp. Silwood2]CAF2840626.1 unnamed protein product [Rotaria sp. Silwood2]CAF3012581.1 unnamed protein product [Rotaria sp. Silwood2]CAF3977218.1 unnamed protein product [Rotaria sp. Silwood2]
MFSYIRKPSSPSITSSNTSFSSDNFYIPTIPTPRSSILRQLDVYDFDGINSTDFIHQRSMPREPFRIPRPILTIPHPTIHVPTNNSIWIPCTRPTRMQQSSTSSSPLSITYHSERPLYQNLPLEPLIPPHPPVSTQYQISPSPFQRNVPIPITQPIKQKQSSREKPPGLFTTLSAGGLSTVAALIYLSFLLALPIIKLILGILYVKECPVNKNIPLYMIISGICGLVIVILVVSSSACTYYRSISNTQKPTHGFIICTIALIRGMQGTLAIFLFIWFIFGNIWIFNARYRVRTDRPNDINNYCHATLYWFAFYSLIFTYIYAAFTCCIKFCVDFFCCGVCDAWHKAFS